MPVHHTTSKARATTPRHTSVRTAKTTRPSKPAVTRTRDSFGGPGGASAAAVARQYLGVRETGNNHNPFSAHFGRPAESWCADFASFVYEKAGKPVGKAGVGFASAQQMANWFASRGQLGHTARPDAAIFFHERGGHAGVNHVGIVTGVDMNGNVHTIEGNSSNAVSARVYRANDPRIVGFGYR